MMYPSLPARSGLRLILLGTLFSAFHIISPVVDMALAVDNVVYGAVLSAIILYLALGPGLPRQTISRNGRLLSFFLLALAGVLVVHGLIHPELARTNFRYILVILIGIGIIHRASRKDLDYTISAIIWIFFIYCLYSIAIHALLAMDSISLEEWAVGNLDWLPQKHPMMTFVLDGTQSYFFYYSMGISRIDDEVVLGPLRFARWNGFFIEPSDVAFVFGPLVLLCMHRIKKDGLIWVPPFVLLSFMLAWAFPASGIIALLFVILLRFILRPTHSYLVKLSRFCAVVVLFSCVVMIVVSPATLFDLMGGNKREQFNFFTNEIAEHKDYYLSPSPFGEGMTADPEHRSYGIAHVLLQHGWLISLAVLAVVGIFATCSIKLLATDNWFVGGAGFVVLALFFKYPDVINLFFLYVGIYVLKTWDERSSSSHLACGPGRT